MKLEVPFYKQETKTDCGPTVLKMVLDYFGKIKTKEELAELAMVDKTGMTWIRISKSSRRIGFKS